ncbi:F-box/LRR-repeat protein 3-like [Rosa rugosa]|uniref:F-box/LRR-repeat protein 3-like n=1 Tax=Rosa rugosa TaxID=74645 RepID=UPI002B409EE5|nr:F-box/LRR-repeat protein 3-like [Rosa rugosa]
MEGLSRSSLRVLNMDNLPRLLSRYPNLATFETPKRMSNADLALVAQTGGLQTIEEIEMQDIRALVRYELELAISVDEVREILRVVHQVGDEGLCALANGCPILSEIVLKRRRVGMVGIMAMITSAAHHLTHLDLEHCSSVSDQALEAIGSSACPIRVLNLKGCSITGAGLRFLANGCCSKTIEQLNLAYCPGITNDGVLLLCKMRVLEELDLSFGSELTDVGGQAISAIQTLKKLNLACVFSLTEKTIVALAKNCINLEMLNLRGGLGVTAAAIDAFLGHKCLQSLNLIGCLFDDVRGSALESLALQCPSLKSIVVNEKWRDRLLQEMQESTVSRFLQFKN